MGLKDFRAERKAMTLDAALLGAPIAGLVAARKQAQAALDACHEAQAGEVPETRGAMEETAQTLGAIVRELSNALNAARDAQKTLDQLARVESRLPT
jgi:hypothetical protein